MVAGGLALAVPSHLAERLVARAGGQPFLGIGVVSVELPPALAARAPLNSGWGALVVNVVEGSPAARAGLLVGDVLVALDSRALFGADGLISALAAAPGGPVRLQVLRGGVPREVVVLLAEAAPLAA
jgi:S1-C subfamily serine protease